MKTRTNNPSFVNFLLHIVGFSLCILPPAICALSYFPLWKSAGYASCIAGGAAVLLILCAVPLYKLLRKVLASFSAYMMWLLLFVLFFALSKIADEMTVISLVGFVGNLLGAICFRLSGRRGE